MNQDKGKPTQPLLGATHSAKVSQPRL